MQPVTVPYSKTLYIGGAVAIIFGPVIAFVAALKLKLLSPEYWMVVVGLVVLTILPVLLGLARLGGRKHFEAFMQKMEVDAGLGRRAIVVLWIVGSLMVIALGLPELL